MSYTSRYLYSDYVLSNTIISRPFTEADWIMFIPLCGECSIIIFYLMMLSS